MRLPRVTLCALALTGSALATAVQSDFGTFVPEALEYQATLGAAIDIDGDRMAVGAPGMVLYGKVGFTLVYRREAGEWVLDGKLHPVPMRLSMMTGYSVALDGDRLIVGSPALENIADNHYTGFAQVYERQGSAWIHVAELAPADGALDDRFGFSVAIEDGRAVVGAPEHGPAGAVYVFEESGSTWQQVDKLVGSSSAGAELGRAVALQGEQIVVGAPGRNGEGAVIVFEGADPWLESEVLVASDPGPNDRFGAALVLLGNELVVGAPGGGTAQRSGVVYCFDHSNGSWSQVDRVTPRSPSQNGEFGSALFRSANRLAVTAPGAQPEGRTHVFDGPGNWQEQAEFTPTGVSQDAEFGFSVALYGDECLVGAPIDDSVELWGGSVIRFHNTGSQWVQGGRLTTLDDRPGARLGAGIQAGWTPAWGAPGHDQAGNKAGAVYVGGDRMDERLIAPGVSAGHEFGSVLASNNEWLAVSAPGADAEQGAVHLYRFVGEAGGRFVYGGVVRAHDGLPGDRFGAAVAINQDSQLFVGAPHDADLGPDTGSIYLFERVADEWTLSAKFLAGDAVRGSKFGASLSLDWEGTQLAVGAPAHASHAGKVYLFANGDRGWSEETGLIPTDSTPGQAFGTSVSASLKTLAVGAPGDAGSTGAVYAFHCEGGQWIEDAKLLAAGGGFGDRFGASLNLGGPTIVAGAPFADVEAPDGGAVYAFHRSGLEWNPISQLLGSGVGAGAELGTSVGLFWQPGSGNAFNGSAGAPAAADGQGAALTWSVPVPSFATTFCYGDGSGAACPCGNESSVGSESGCTTGMNLHHGAWMRVGGETRTDSVSADDITFLCAWSARNQTAMLFAGTTQIAGGSGLPFGDGLRCVGGQIVRLGLRTTSSGYGTAIWGPGLASQAGWQPGQTRYFQTWFRDPNGPCGTGHSLTNGLAVVFGP